MNVQENLAGWARAFLASRVRLETIEPPNQLADPIINIDTDISVSDAERAHLSVGGTAPLRDVNDLVYFAHTVAAGDGDTFNGDTRLIGNAFTAYLLVRRVVRAQIEAAVQELRVARPATYNDRAELEDFVDAQAWGVLGSRTDELFGPMEDAQAPFYDAWTRALGASNENPASERAMQEAEIAESSRFDYTLAPQTRSLLTRSDVHKAFEFLVRVRNNTLNDEFTPLRTRRIMRVLEMLARTSREFDTREFKLASSQSLVRLNRAYGKFSRFTA